MSETLLRFLKQHEGKGAVWFVVPGGIISGTVALIESLSPDAITLIDASIRRGDILEAVGHAHILVAQISAWGEIIGSVARHL